MAEVAGAADALAALLRAGVPPSDPRLATLAALVRNTPPPLPLPPDARVLPFERGQQRVTAAVAAAAHAPFAAAPAKNVEVSPIGGDQCDVDPVVPPDSKEAPNKDPPQPAKADEGPDAAGATATATATAAAAAASELADSSAVASALNSNPAHASTAPTSAKPALIAPPVPTPPEGPLPAGAHQAPRSVFAAASAASSAAAPCRESALNSTPTKDDTEAALIFRTRAQIAAFRALSRGTDPAPEVLIASAGRRRPRTALSSVDAKEGAKEMAKVPVADETDVNGKVEREAALVAGRRGVSFLEGPPADSSRPLSYKELVAERGERVNTKIASRLSELNDLVAMPHTLPSDVMRCVKIQQKSLALVGKQRALRDEVMGVMRNELTQPDPLKLGGGVAVFRRHAPALTNVDGRDIGPCAAVSLLEKSAQERIIALEIQHRKVMEERRLRRQAKFSSALLQHGTSFRTTKYQHSQLDKRLFKDLDRHFRDKVREVDRRKKKEQHDRLRALRNHDEDGYLALLEKTKNTRLLQLIKQTDQYLGQLGAKVEAQKEATMAQERAEREAAGEGSDAELKEEEAAERSGSDAARGGDGDGPGVSVVQQMRARRNQYYTVSHSILETVEQPSILVGGKLKPYQIEGLKWMVSLYNNGLNGILADEMGLGKTIQTISLITYLTEFKYNKGPYLIIVPLSTMSNWVRELETWAPSLVKVVYRGNPETRKRIQQEEMADGSFNVVLTTYEFVVKDKLYLGRTKWQYIIIDEGHRMKNADCKLALALGAKYRSRNRILLTGTPLQNNLTELWALLNFILPTIFSSAETFETWFNAPFQASALGGGGDLNEEEQLLVISRLHQVLRPFMLRRLKTDVETQLPEKIERVLRCDMSIWQKVLYRQMRSNLGIASSGSVRTYNNVVMQLKKVCNHPYLFYQEDELFSVPRDFLMRAAGKFEMLEHALSKLKATGHRVLLFSQMTAALDLLEYFLASVNMKHMRLDGTTKADDRQTMLEQFNAPDSEYFIFLLSTRAGGLGLNLQTADTVFIFDSDWNPMMDLQAQDRAHRIGQTKEVRVFRLITASSVEEKILERANEKLQMDARVIQAGQFNNQSSDTDRTQMLKQILQEQAKEDEDEDDIPPLDELNRMLARSDEEFEKFQEMDRVRLAEDEKNGVTRLLVDEDDLPKWVLQPELKEKPKGKHEDVELEDVEYDINGRSRRKRSSVTYNDGLTDREFARAVERDEDITEAARRKRQRLSENSASADDANADVENLANGNGRKTVGSGGD